MIRLPLYVTAQRWNTGLVDALGGKADGVVLGDLFCQKRMFAGEWFDVEELAGRARAAGLEVVFQTPMYNTPRDFEPTLALVERLAGRGLVDAVMLHDVGVLAACAGLDAALWWDRHGFNRDFVPSAPLLEFLRENGVARVEGLHPRHAVAIRAGGAEPLLYCFGPHVASFGRICYTEYFRNEPCGRKILCRDHRPAISSTDRVHLEYVADGYTLLDRADPDVRLARLQPAERAALGGLTAYIRSPAEIEPLLALRDTLARAGDGEDAPVAAGAHAHAARP